jgi:hypothetical protein
MKKIVLSVMALLLTAGLVYAKGIDVQKKAGEYTVNIKMDKVPSVGANDLVIGIKDAKETVTDAKVTVDYSMPAMPGMAPMNYRTAAALKGSAYNAVLDLSMAGPWNINIKIARGGKVRSAKLSIDVS